MITHIKLGWLPHEILWLEAALSLPKYERTEAYKDIAQMMGRSLNSVRDKAYVLASEMRIAAAEATWKDTQAARRFPSRPTRRPAVLPSELEQPTVAQRMAGRAR